MKDEHEMPQVTSFAEVPQQELNNQLGEIYSRGVDYMLQKRYDKAESLFRKVLELDPGHAAATFRLQELEQRKEIASIVGKQHAKRT